MWSRVGILYPLSPRFPDPVSHASYLRYDKDRTMLKQSILGSVEEFAKEMKNRKLVSDEKKLLISSHSKFLVYFGFTKIFSFIGGVNQWSHPASSSGTCLGSQTSTTTEGHELQKNYSCKFVNDYIEFN